ncbi:MAG: hypothetical protein J6C85_07040 [Alphaproteobacteria bacterium]|nr:hypothetical protein [Alphaproteobacteria bacterium]
MALVPTVFAALIVFGGIVQIAQDCRMFNRKSHFFALRVLFFALFIVTEVLFYLCIGLEYWNLTLLFGTFLIIMLPYFIWFWSKHNAYVNTVDKWLLIFVHLSLIIGLYLTNYLCESINNYKWEHKKVYVVKSIENNAQDKKTDTLYIFNGKVITKPAD